MKTYDSILITGASSGIGAALAVAYAGPGICLRLIGRHEARLQAVAAAVAEKGSTVDTATIDVTDEAAMTAQLHTWDDAQPIDLVIANAGVSDGSSSGAGFGHIMDVNVNGTLHTVTPLIPRMQARGRGQIAVMSSMAGWRGMPNAPAYSVSKMAVRGWGEAMRPRLAADGIGVSVIFPGFVKTPLTDVNPFPMPFLMTAERAARIIRRGLARNRARIAFPVRMLLLSRLVAALPLWLGDWILARAPRKPE